MGSTLKLVSIIGAAAVVGIVVGYAIGASGKRGLEQKLQLQVKKAGEAEAALKQQSEECAEQARSTRAARQIQLVKEQLLRAVLELQVSNYGLASQHLGLARTELKAAERSLKQKQLASSAGLFDRIGGAQTLAMRLDPMARVQIEQILNELQKLSGAK